MAVEAGRHVATPEEIEEEMKIPIEDRVTPLHKLPYEEQIALKKRNLEEVLSKFHKQLRKEFKQQGSEVLPPWIEDAKSQLDETPCVLETVLQCDTEHRIGYRNKVEFTIGNRYSDGTVCVGFNAGNQSKGYMFVEPPNNVRNISESAVEAARLMQSIVERSGASAYDRAKHTGLWRLLIVKESWRTKEMLVCIVISSQKTEEEEQAWKQSLEEIQKTFGQGAKIGERTVESLSYITSSELSGGYNMDQTDGKQDLLVLQDGRNYYYEEVVSLRFMVSPLAFFQVNTHMFEKMLNLIEEWAQIDEKTILLDICCGTGIIGLSLSRKANKVVGIEIIESAVEDARRNAANNKIDNCEFVAARAEEAFSKIIADIGSDQRIVAIVDPPRGGLHRDVLKGIRTCKGLDRLVYVSCNAGSLVDNMSHLCYGAQKKRKGPPFRPVKCAGADLFPDCNHCECIMLFERFY